MSTAPSAALPRAVEIARRRTFAIISHPDAGKTTLTEKLLLYGGAIRTAGAVKARRASTHATSDWMAIEKERGISVGTSVMAFEYDELRYNLLDTPGHNDFSEDTYRTLAAADCAVMLIDNAKGVEAQTIKLFEVCRMRGIPIVTFVNKLDREGKPLLDVLDEIETTLGIPTCPMNWPIGQGQRFQGVFDRETGAFVRFDRAEKKGKRAEARTFDLSDDALAEEVGESALEELREDIELLDDAGNPWDEETFLAGKLSPVFFGSAMNSFGVEPFLQRFATLCPPPAGRVANDEMIAPDDPMFTGFVFKIQANMDPKHRDRIAFVRVVSGEFEKGMKVMLPRTGKKISIDRSVTFMANSRANVEEAYAGDIIGVWDPGVLRIGDSMVNGKKKLTFQGIPSFSPEFFVRARLKDPMKRKQLKKGLDQLSEEGAVQIFRDRFNDVEPVLGAVGWLQIEVVQHRLKAEYNVEVAIERMPYKEARWIFGGDDLDPAKLVRQGTVELLYDIEDRPLLLFDHQWTRRRLEDKMPECEFVAAVQPGRSKKAR